jgi:hypothetical protein
MYLKSLFAIESYSAKNILIILLCTFGASTLVQQKSSGTNMTLLTLLTLCAALALSACSGSNASNGSASASSSTGATGGSSTPVSGQPGSGPVIDNEDMTAGLRGVDADNNGIRDDIDRLIAKKYSATPELKKAVEQKARANQKFMEASTKQQALIAGDEISRASACTASVVLKKDVPDTEKLFLQIGKDLRALIRNTPERYRKYEQSNQLAGGAVFEQPPEPVCD